jgi:cytochrome P450
MSSAAAAEAPASSIPDHVPPALVKTFDFRTNLGDRPQEVVARLLDGPPIFWSPVRHVHAPGGAWVVANAELIKKVMSDPDTFTSSVQGESLAFMGEGFVFAPLGVDPPRHKNFRALINPLFSPARMVALAPQIHSWCDELIDRFQDKKRCNFITEFADQFPTGIFIDLMGFDRARVPEFVGWVQDFIHGATLDDRKNGIMRSAEFFGDVFDNRENYAEGTMVRYLLDAEPEGRPLTRSEFIGTAFMVFTAGLDTVVSSLGFIFRLLAEKPELQTYLRDNKGQIPRYVEEMMRLFSPVTPQRRAACDVELGGVQIRAGDPMALALTAASRDPALFPDPTTLDATRNPNPHFAFGSGIHRCAGAQLARRDLAIALEIWLERIRDFRLAPESEITAAGGAVQSLNGIVFEWD